MDLRLFNRLQISDTATLILREQPGEMLEYFIIAQTVGFAAVCAGKMSGIINRKMLSFNIRLSSVVPLIEKGYKFSIRYEDGDLYFVTEDERVKIRPLYVEYQDASATQVVQNYLDFYKAMEKFNRAQEREEELKEEIRMATGTRDGMLRMHLSGPPSEDPFTPDEVPDKITDKYDEIIRDKESQLAGIQDALQAITPLDMKPFAEISGVASRFHEIVSFCDSYALTTLHNSYLLVKHSCPVMAVQGQLLNTLIKDKGGTGFFFFADKLVYTSGSKDNTTVFVTKYLPNSDVDSSIITRGVVREKYSIHLKEMLALASVVRSKFPVLKLDLGHGEFIMSNDSGETITSKFDVEDAKTVQLAKMMKGVPVKGEITMATIEVPKEVQGVLTLFKEKLTIYVKDNKIIFQSGEIYLVFGR